MKSEEIMPKIHKLPLPHDGEYTLIDESHSVGPESLKTAIRNLDDMKIDCQPGSGRKIAIIEIGDNSQEYNTQIGKLLAESSIDVVIGICPEVKDILSQLTPAQEQYYFEDNTGLENFLAHELLQDGDTILIKGSQYGSGLRQTVERLIETVPEN